MGEKTQYYELEKTTPLKPTNLNGQIDDNLVKIDTAMHNNSVKADAKQDKLSTAQQSAVDSGITSAKVSQYDNYSTTKQDKLVSGTNIKTVNGTTILGSGDIPSPGASNGVKKDTDGKYKIDESKMSLIITDLHRQDSDVGEDYIRIRVEGYMPSVDGPITGGQITIPAAKPTDDKAGLYTKELAAEKQDALPTVVKDKYLHTNESTGALEWKEVAQGGTSFAAITGEPTDNAKLAAALDAKEQTLVAGTNITLDRTTTPGKTIIKASGTPTGSVAFADITGQPTDNTNLNTALNEKAKQTDLTAHTSDANIHTTATEKATWNAKQDALPAATKNLYLHANASTGALEWASAGSGSANWGSIGGTLTDQTDLSNALNAKENELVAGENITLDRTTTAGKTIIKSTGGSGKTYYAPVVDGTPGQFTVRKDDGTIGWATADNTPTSGSNNLISSDAVYDSVTAETSRATLAENNLSMSILNKQDKLPNVVADRYLHTNSETGDLEWKAVEGGTAAFSTITGSPRDNAKLAQELDKKQDTLPTVTNDRYLHTNASTGALEWSEVASGSTSFAQITGSPDDNTKLKEALGAKAKATDLTAHTADGDIHVTAEQKTKWNAKQEALPTTTEKSKFLTMNDGNLEWSTPIDDTLTESSAKAYSINKVLDLLKNYSSKYVGSFPTYADLEAFTGMDENDVAMVQRDENHDQFATSYRYSEEAWVFQYEIKVAFTNSQWASIDSGITAESVAQIATNKTDIATLNTTTATHTTEIATLTTDMAGKMNKLSTEPGSGMEYRFPFNINTPVQNEGDITATFDTLVLNDGTTKDTYTITIPAALPESNLAGLYTQALANAKSKVVKLDSVGETATDIKFISIDGVEYKIPDVQPTEQEYIELTAAYAEDTGQYVGDITAEQAEKMKTTKLPMRITATNGESTMPMLVETYIIRNDSMLTADIIAVNGDTNVVSRLFIKIDLASTTGALCIKEYHSVSATESGTSETELKYITIDGTEYKIPEPTAITEYLKTAAVENEVLTITPNGEGATAVTLDVSTKFDKTNITDDWTEEGASDKVWSSAAGSTMYSTVSTKFTTVNNNITDINTKITELQSDKVDKATGFDLAKITLNGTVTTQPSFYAPLSLGEAGQLLTTDGTSVSWKSIASALKFCGSATKAEIEAKTGMNIGDVWSASDEEYTNYAYNGSTWENIGKTMDMSLYQTKAVSAASMALMSDASGNINVSTVSATELSYLSGVTSAIQTQFDAKQKKITYGTADPTGGSSGDIYIKYTA